MAKKRILNILEYSNKIKKDIKITYDVTQRQFVIMFEHSDIEAFTIAHPQFKIERRSYSPNFKLDPVILGVTKDSRMFMICWWDIQKDIDKVLANINLFKKFKVK